MERVTDDGCKVIEVPLPTVLTISNQIGEPRRATIKGIMAAKEKGPIIWNPVDIGVDTSQIGAKWRRTKILNMFQPAREGQCEMVEGETSEEARANLALKLREAKVL